VTRPFFGFGLAWVARFFYDARRRFAAYGSARLAATASEQTHTFAPPLANLTVMNLARGSDAVIRLNGGADVDLPARTALEFEDMDPIATVAYRVAPAAAPATIACVGQR
jgi:hypothetical protein